MIQRLGRAIGPGRLERMQRGGGSPRWVLTWSDAQGKRHRQSLSTDKRVAERLRSEIIRTRDMELAGLGAESGQDRPLRELVDAYLGDLRTRACSEHLRNMCQGLEEALAAIPAKRVGELRPVMLIEHRARKLAGGASARTANLATDRLRACLNWCVQLDMIAKNPVQKLPRLKENESTARYRRRALSEVEITRFLDAARDDDRTIAEEGSLRGLPRVPQTPLWRSMLETGARYGELTRVAWADLDLDRRTLLLRAEHTKAGRSREIPLLPDLTDELRALRVDHVRVLQRPLRPDDRVYLTPRGRAWCMATNNLRRIFDRLLESAGIDRLDAQGRQLDIHALRHTAATRFARAGMPLTHAQFVLGHSDPKLTAKIYTHLDAHDVRASIERIAGKSGTEKGVARSA
jgi:integrase